MKFQSKSFVISAFIVLVLLANLAGAQEPKKMPERTRLSTNVAHNKGFIPPPFDLSHLADAKIAQKLQALEIPERWDWREQGIITPVQDQGGCGACYAFASLANIESRLLIEGDGPYNFSENHAKECNWYETGCSGGWYEQMINLFTKHGTVLEACNPYVDKEVGCDTTCPYITTPLDWRIISGQNIPDADLLKNYIYTYGPVFTTFYAGDDNDPEWDTEFGNYDGSYTLHYNASDSSINHAVLIVGWDDNLSHENGQGAWIVKNSWGANWGGPCGFGSENGYFTIAYGSANMGMYSSFLLDWQDYDEKGDILFYDEGGWSSLWGYGRTTAWGLCKFESSDAYSLENVEFWTSDVTTDIDIYIYDDFDGSSPSQLVDQKLDLSFDEAGYHSVQMDIPLYQFSNKDFYVALKITNQSFNYPMVSDDEGPFETGTTFLSLSGEDDTWTDMGAEYQNDIAIRARLTAFDRIIVLSPNGNEEWKVGTEQSIQWEAPHSISNVKIEFSYDGGLNWNVVDASTANDGSYSWIIPDNPSDKCLIKVSDVDNPANFDESDKAFTITKPTLTVLLPNGEEKWDVNSSQEILWNSTGDIDRVRISYSTDGGESWTIIVASTDNDGMYEWTIPDTPSDHCLVKIADAFENNVFDTSDDFFSIIRSSITIILPNGGESWTANTSQQIIWKSTGKIDKVKISYSTDLGNTWSIISDSTENDDNYDWTVPNTPSDSCLIKVSDVFDINIFDVSDERFAITPEPSPNIVVMPDTLFFFIEHQKSQSQTLKSNPDIASELWVHNDGNADLNVTGISSAATWIASISDSSFLLKPDEEKTVNVRCNADTVVDGTYSGNLRIASNDPDTPVYTVTLLLTVITNYAPQVKNSIADTMLVKDSLLEIDLDSPPLFFDPDADDLKYTASSSAPSIVSPEVVDSMLYVSALSEGSAVLTIGASDGRGGADSSNFEVNVGVLQPPENLSALSLDSSTVVLTWDAPGSNSCFTLEHYKIYCSRQADPCKNAENIETTDAQTTTFKHENLNVGDNWHYAIKAIYNGSRMSPPCSEANVVVNVDDTIAQHPSEFNLSQNYPNPFNPTTEIQFSVPEPSHVKIIVYNMLGENVAKLTNRKYEPGRYTLVFNAERFSSGLYFYVMRAGKFRALKKMAILK